MSVKLCSLNFLQEYKDFSLRHNIQKDFIVVFTMPHIVFNTGNVVRLGTFVKKNKNADAVSLMNHICRLADKHEVDIHLDVVPMYVYMYYDKGGNDNLVKEKLEKYYSKFGFETSEKVTYVNKAMTLETDINMVRLAQKFK